MTLYLLRHGPAEPAGDAGDDYGRRLTPEGRRIVERAVAGMKGAGYFPDHVVTSPLPRAKETAEIVGAVFGLAVVTDDRMRLDTDPEAIVALIGDLKRYQAPVLVGHQPDLERVIHRLTGRAVPVPKAALVVLQLPEGDARRTEFGKLLRADVLASLAP